jgi:purine nucleoside permease
LTFLSAAGKADTNRVLVLRTASNFDQQPPGKTAAESLAEENDGKYSAYIPSLEAAYRVGSKVVHALVDRWSEYSVTIPTAKSGSP